MRSKLRQFFLGITVLSVLALTITQCAIRQTQAQKQFAGACASDIGVGENGSAWILGCGPPVGAGDFYIFSWNSKWDMIPGVATDIAVEPTGTPWITNGGGQIYKRSANGWEQIPGCAKDIGVGNNGFAWILGCASAEDGGFEIYSWNDSKWNKVSGSATRIAVEPNGTPWVISVKGKIFRL